jgi:hypothetical protein
MQEGVLAYPALAQSAAQRYIAHLKEVEAGAQPMAPTQRPLRDLIETLEAAERLGPGLDPADVRFRVSSLGEKTLTANELEPFLNEFQLGLGYDGAPIVAMGTETADDPGKPEDLAWGCLQTVLILSGSPQRVVEGLLKQSSWWAKMEDHGLPKDPWRPFHIHPNDLYQVQRQSDTHTWINLARLLLPAGTSSETLLSQSAEPGLGDRVYQIERSALPAKQSSRGKVPTRARTDWLVREVIPPLRQTAHTLLLHGFGNGKVWDENAVELINAFLGYDSGTPTKVDWRSVTAKRGDWLWSRVEGNHRRNGIVDWPHRGRVIWPHPRAPLLTFLETIPRTWSDR